MHAQVKVQVKFSTIASKCAEIFATHIGNYKQNILAVLFCRSHFICPQKSQFLQSKVAPGNSPDVQSAEGAVDLNRHKKGLHVNSKVTLTVNGNFCSSISRNEHERSFMSTRRDGLHSLTYIHYDGAEARMPRTPRHRHAKQLHERPNYQVHTCCQHIGEVILAQPLDHTGKPSANVEATSDTLLYFLLEQAVHDVRGCHFLTIATSPRHVFAHARGPRSDRDPRSRRDLCAQVTPRRRTKEPLS